MSFEVCCKGGMHTSFQLHSTNVAVGIIGARMKIYEVALQLGWCYNWNEYGGIAKHCYVLGHTKLFISFWYLPCKSGHAGRQFSGL